MQLCINLPRNNNNMWIGGNVTVCPGVTIGSKVADGEE